MDIQIASVSRIHVSLSESEAQEFVLDASAVQKCMYELLFPVNAQSARSKESPKAVGRKASKREPKIGTFICPHCDQVFKRCKNFDRHVVKCQPTLDAGIVVDS